MEITSYLLGKKAGGGTTPTGTIDITENGTTNVTNYATANVNVQPTLQNKSVPITTNGSTSISADENYDGLGTVSITTNVQPNLESKSITITENTTTTISPTQGKDGLSSVEVITNVSGGGVVEEKDANFYDWDGTLLYSYTKSEFLELTEMPANPTRAGFTAQGWNWTLADAKLSIDAVGKIDIGQMYITSDGKTRIYVSLMKEGGLSPTMCLLVSGGSINVDWGDGTDEDFSTDFEQQHNYSAEGDYVITITPTENATFTLTTTSTSSKFFCKSNSASAEEDDYYNGCVTKLEIGTNHSNYFEGCPRCTSLKHVNIPNYMEGVSTCDRSGLEIVIAPINATSQYSIGSFQYCGSLKKFIFSNIQGNGAAYKFQYCTSLEKIVFPYHKTTFSQYECAYCGNLKEVYSIAKFDSNNYVFRECRSLTKVNNNRLECVYGRGLGEYTLNSTNIKELYIKCKNASSSSLANNLQLKKVIIEFDNYNQYGVDISGAFQYEESGLAYLHIIGNCGVINNNTFANTKCLKTIWFEDCNNIPSMSGAYLNNLPSDFKVIVPDDLYEDWIVATGWNTYASHIVKESEA